jgi:hypothetical protein
MEDLEWNGLYMVRFKCYNPVKKHDLIKLLCDRLWRQFRRSLRNSADTKLPQQLPFRHAM